ncbi:tRNA-2-methylthio-N(6)-dimethylallyladenosine synthase [Dirofilaria immitis]
MENGLGSSKYFLILVKSSFIDFVQNLDKQRTSDPHFYRTIIGKCSLWFQSQSTLRLRSDKFNVVKCTEPKALL